MTYESERRQVVDLCLQLSHRGFFAGTGGNIMLRIDAELVAVTPSATDYLTMQPQDVCVLRLADLSPVAGDRTPSVETGLHAQVLTRRPDVVCSIHTHQPVASALALIGRPLAVPQALHGLLGAQVPVVGYAPSGSGWLARKLARTLRPDLNAYLMRNHGILCCGRGVREAMSAVSALEQIAREQLLNGIRARAIANPPGREGLTQLAQSLSSEQSV
ncbi:class II aldolase/adducin family protein [Rubrivivax gelatinosus]|uniref:Class II aldolase/adducin N-terminal domain-containing protein n=1 Tax=Rubrivivax gelatinosus (strain NBRC 100245 / IL144) TaxID=983917 RepID=I0HN71_RUBGI|nr:class II aldolase/adducin family protein [Rubrivivax gelatinosus]BAL94458.1 hypothetical protein RGE_11170 [Rubrivivax gelatinosus IL144]